MEMVQAVYQQNLLYPTAREGILNLIPKANKDTRIIKNLRPITLLNTDYKIIEKACSKQNDSGFRIYYPHRSKRFYEG